MRARQTDERDLAILRMTHTMKAADVAAELGCSESTVLNRKSQIRRDDIAMSGEPEAIVNKAYQHGS